MGDRLVRRAAGLPALMAVACVLAGCQDTEPDAASTSTATRTASPTTSSVSGGTGPAAAPSTATNPRPDTLYPDRGSAGIDVQHYDLDLAWDRDQRTLTGTATLLVRPVSDQPTLQLDLSDAMHVDGATVDGKPVSTTPAPGHRLTLRTALRASAQRTVVIRYRGTPTPVKAPTTRTDETEGLGLRATDDGQLWTMQEPYGAFTWYPVNDLPSDKASYDISVRAPHGWTGVATGTPSSAPQGTTRFVSTKPVASYLTTLAVGPYTKHTGTGPRGLALTYWTRPSDGDELRVLQKSPQYLSWLEKRFGPYPFASAGAVVVDSESAMETQQLVTFGGKPSPGQTDADTELTVVHEYAHQWFGDEVGPSTWTDLWLNEGWAMYAQLLFEKERDQVPDAEFTTWLRGADEHYRKQYGPPGRPRADQFAQSNVYMVPANMLHQLHHRLGDEKFFALARDWVAQHRGQAVDRSTFTAFVSRHTGRDFTALINRYLDSTTTPAG